MKTMKTTLLMMTLMVMVSVSGQLLASTNINNVTEGTTIYNPNPIQNAVFSER